MTKLIGTNPNQVPSNADLGSAAFMEKKDFLTSRGSSLSEINSIMPATAKAVFIYDTSKDSDGGAWRKRTQNTTWYIGLKGAGTPVAADTMASHSSWAELTGYSGNRKEWTEGAASGGSMTNSSSVDFTINATATIAGAFLNTAATGTAGVLYGVVDFSSSRAVISGDTLQVTVTVTAASA